MSLTPFQISLNIKSLKFREAEQGILQFVLFNADDKNELNFLSQNNSFQNSQPQVTSSLENICNEYATVISELFCHPRYKPSDGIIHSFLSYKFVLDWLFSASIWKNTDAIIDHLKLVQINSFGQLQVDFNQKKTTILLALVSLSSKYKLPWKKLFELNPAIAMSSYIGLVTQSIPALSQENDRGFNYLLESASDLPILNLPVITDLGKLNYAYFNCSYASSPDKYEFKKWLTTQIRHNLQQWLDDEVKKYISILSNRQISEKPKVCVMLEHYSLNHAMYRSFNVRLRNLAKKYDLIAFIDNNEIDTADLTIFSKVVGLLNVFDVNGNAKLVISEKPDIIFYPSIGMKFWGIYLSQLRLAPLQMMMGGHPSSSFSPEIDYCLVPGDTFTAEDIQPFFSEKVIMTKQASRNSQVSTRHPDLTTEFLAEHSQFLNEEENFRIGINGVMTKVTYLTIEVCRKIERKASKNVTFVFFSGHSKKQLAYIATKNQLSKMLKSFELVSFSDYLQYLKMVSSCHFLLPTLPFGGANSNVDAMILNKPKLFLKSNQQLYTRTDNIVWERVNLVKELGSDTVDGLVDKALLLINNTEQRRELHDLISVRCSSEKVFNNSDNYKHSINEHFDLAINDHISKYQV
ncbi:hypothetical protein [Paraglaciecola arctica]|uniref:hypothetical protein n=1 Tax=Paraglaciecola arctica TaxID=1128911 RepID=UPI001C06B589|nr:hypothetical protein [Paraglaciecola arctica]MBU3003039.1 hypothetical protein [Paraglaciecola arctica]